MKDEAEEVKGGGHVKVIDGTRLASESEPEEGAVRHRMFALVDRTG